MGSPSRRGSQHLRTTAIAYVFLLPLLLVFAAFVAAPLCYTFWISLFREAIVGGVRFVGAANYLRALGDASFWGGWVNVARYALAYIPILTVLALLIALLLDSGTIWRSSLFQAGLSLTYTVPTVIAAVIWSYLYGPRFGLLGQVARGAGFPAPDLYAPPVLPFSIANISIWQLTGYVMLLFYGALKAVPPELEEAAALDGARGWQYALHVKLPLIRSSIVLSLMFSTIGCLQLFAEPYLLRSNAPERIKNDFTPNMYSFWQAFGAHDYSYSAAISFVLGTLVLMIVAAFLALANRFGAASK